MIVVSKSCIISDNLWLLLVKISIATGMIAGMTMSVNLWIGERLLPPIPIVNIHLADWMNVIFVIAFVVGLVFTVVSDKKEGPVAVIFLGTILIFLDQLRLQPWVYLYVLLFIPFAFDVRDRDGISRYFLVVIAGVYFWSGIHKLNDHFLDGNYGTNLKSIFGYNFKSNTELFRLLGYGIGLVESAIGLGLLFDLTRRVAVFGATLMHLLIIAFVIFQPSVNDLIVIPWNIVMIILNLLTFYPLRSPFKNLTSVKMRSGILIGFIVILVWLCPVFNFVGRWDHFLSFSLYSNKVPMFYVAIHDDDVNRIDLRLKKYFVSLPGLSGGRILDVHSWSEDELHVPFYPEKRAFVKLTSYFCHLGIPESHIVFLELAVGDSKAPVIDSFSCPASGQ